MTPLARLAGVHKSFGETHALRGIDLTVHAGETVAVLGPNGAGKTTAFAILLGLRRADAGGVELLGGDPRRREARAHVGVVAQESSYPPGLRVREIVELVRAHYRNPLALEEVAARFAVTELLERQAGGLSGGEGRRLALALAFVGRPRLTVLDEPTAGLDIEARRSAWSTLRSYVGEGGAVLLTTHHIEEAETLASRVVVLARGQVVAEGTASELRVRAGRRAAADVTLEDAFLQLARESG